MGIVGVLLGILAIACAVMATFLFGTIGGVAAAVIAALAIILGILKRKNTGKGGVPAIVIGSLAILMSFFMTSVWSGLFTEVHNKAVEMKPDGLWAQATTNTTGGIMGIIKALPQDEASVNAFIEEMNELNNMSE